MRSLVDERDAAAAAYQKAAMISASKAGKAAKRLVAANEALHHARKWIGEIP